MGGEDAGINTNKTRKQTADTVVGDLVTFPSSLRTLICYCFSNKQRRIKDYNFLCHSRGQDSETSAVCVVSTVRRDACFHYLKYWRQNPHLPRLPSFCYRHMKGTKGTSSHWQTAAGSNSSACPCNLYLPCTRFFYSEGCVASGYVVLMSCVRRGSGCRCDPRRCKEKTRRAGGQEGQRHKKKKKNTVKVTHLHGYTHIAGCQRLVNRLAQRLPPQQGTINSL